MKSIRYTATLFYYDGIQIFEARDAIGGHYVAVMIEPMNGADRYLLAGVEPERLRQFRIGELDFRSLLLERAEGDWFTATAWDGLEAPLDLEPQTAPLQDCPDLPDPGFLLHDSPAESEVVREARSRNNLVLEIAVEPPEAAEEHQAETVLLMGSLQKADNGKGDWRLATDEGEFSGKIKPDGPSLEGLKIGGRYQFTCLEEIEESQSGREQRTLYLVEHEPA